MDALTQSMIFGECMLITIASRMLSLGFESEFLIRTVSMPYDGGSFYNLSFIVSSYLDLFDGYLNLW